jgi:hypothetical protein
MFGKTNIMENRRRGGAVVVIVGEGARWRGGMRLEAVIAAGTMPARRACPPLGRNP